MVWQRLYQLSKKHCNFHRNFHAKTRKMTTDMRSAGLAACGGGDGCAAGDAACFAGGRGDRGEEPDHDGGDAEDRLFS